jgi:hypothetical protein
MNMRSTFENCDNSTLTGSLLSAGHEPTSGLQRLAYHLVAHVVLAPLILLIGAVLVAGFAGLIGKIAQLRGGRGQFAALWPCFLAALALTLISLLVHRYSRRVSRRTIQEVQYAHGEISYWVAENNDWITRAINNIRSIGECPGTQGPIKIVFRDGAWIVLAPLTPNGAALLERLTHDRKSCGPEVIT